MQKSCADIMQCMPNPMTMSEAFSQMVMTFCYRFVIIPDMLKNAPMFKRIDPKMKVCSGVQSP